jgi:acyl dehydratase
MNLPPQFASGYGRELGRHRFTEAEIIRFAGKYDPQPFHMNPEAARKSVLGGLCASGWHTVAVWMRYYRQNEKKLAAELKEQGFPPAEFGPSPGIEQLRWIRPVYVDDVVTYVNEIAQSRPSASKKGWFVITSNMSGINQNDKPVITFTGSAFLRYPA